MRVLRLNRLQPLHEGRKVHPVPERRSPSIIGAASSKNRYYFLSRKAVRISHPAKRVSRSSILTNSSIPISAAIFRRDRCSDLRRISESTSNLNTVCSAQNFAAREKLVFLGVHWMCFNFHDRSPSNREDLIDAALRFKGREREEVIGKLVPFCQHMIDSSPIQPVDPALFRRPEGKVSSYYRGGRQQFAEQHIGAEVHVVMAVEAPWLTAEYPLKLLNLRRCYVLERRSQSRMIQGWCQPVSAQIMDEPSLVLPKA